MKKYIVFIFIINISPLWIHAQQSSTAIQIIPAPQQITRSEGQFVFNEHTQIAFDQANAELKNTALYLQHFLQEATHLPFKIATKNAPENNVIYLGVASNFVANTSENKQLSAETYQLIIKNKSISITGKSIAGVFYGFQTLRQLLPAAIENKGKVKSLNTWTLPCLSIFDYPTFAWRGLNLDCCRHFMDKAFILHYLDVLAYYKMNKFHWHLTEDQAWRIEIKKYPKLTSVGAFRKEKEGNIYGGFYTQADIKEVVAYAAKLNIEVIPEIEMPGHSLAAIAAYPGLSCTKAPLAVANTWGVFKDIYCAGSDSTFIFLENVLTEVFALFPSKYIHIGGDEAPKYRWENCADCQQRMQNEKLKDAHELQSYFIKRMEKFANSNGKKIIGWDEILEGGLAPNATVQSWRGVEGAIAAVNSQHDAIVSPTSHCYFDYSLKSIDLAKVYSFNPIPAGISAENEKYILGGECNMWTEKAPQNLVDSKVFPRLLALAEVLWTNPMPRNFEAFNQRVESHYPRLTSLGIRYGFDKQAITFSIQANPMAKAFQVELIPAQADLKILYTLDQSLPQIGNPKAILYDKAIELQEACILKAAIQQADTNQLEVFSRQFDIHQAIAKPCSIKVKPSDSYAANDANSLVDGLIGSIDFHDGLWLGFQQNNLEAIIDLGENQKINSIQAHFLQSMPSWILFPESVSLYTSSDGIQFKLYKVMENKFPQNVSETSMQNFTFDLSNTATRYIKVIAKKVDKCPEWHEAAGSEAWLFVDEISIY
jgi:hexosaminidase